jgi:hypothetical protein
MTVDLIQFVRVMVSGDTQGALGLLETAPDLAKERARVGASRQVVEEYFFEEISHYLYAGDTALHMAAASHAPEVARRLLELGADHAARNRRGAQPLHYAADTNFRDLKAQGETVQILCRAGANPNALDRTGVAPLHRAVRTRSAAAVEALLSAEADANLQNKKGSTPLDLAMKNSGRGGSSSPPAKVQRQQIIALLLRHGAPASDADARGETRRASKSKRG